MSCCCCRTSLQSSNRHTGNIPSATQWAVTLSLTLTLERKDCPCWRSWFTCLCVHRWGNGMSITRQRETSLKSLLLSGKCSLSSLALHRSMNQNKWERFKFYRKHSCVMCHIRKGGQLAKGVLYPWQQESASEANGSTMGAIDIDILGLRMGDIQDQRGVFCHWERFRSAISWIWQTVIWAVAHWINLNERAGLPTEMDASQTTPWERAKAGEWLTVGDSCSPAMEFGLFDYFSCFVSMAPRCKSINKPGSVHTLIAHEFHISHSLECAAHWEASPFHLVKSICVHQPMMTHHPPTSSKQYCAVIYTLSISLLLWPLMRPARSTALLSQTLCSVAQADTWMYGSNTASILKANISSWHVRQYYTVKRKCSNLTIKILTVCTHFVSA